MDAKKVTETNRRLRDHREVVRKSRDVSGKTADSRLARGPRFSLTGREEDLSGMSRAGAFGGSPSSSLSDLDHDTGPFEVP